MGAFVSRSACFRYQGRRSSDSAARIQRMLPRVSADRVPPVGSGHGVYRSKPGRKSEISGMSVTRASDMRRGT